MKNWGGRGGHTIVNDSMETPFPSQFSRKKEIHGGIVVQSVFHGCA